MRLRKKKNLETLLKEAEAAVISVDLGNKNASIEEKRYLDLEAIFGRKAPLWLEIGCGKGVFALELARRFPRVNIVAIERISNVLVEGALAAAKGDFANLRFFCAGAEYLTRFFRKGGVDKIFLNFSTPFPKPANENRRLTSRDYVDVYYHLLRDGGKIELKTDDGDFFNYSVESFASCGLGIEETDNNYFSDDNIITEHERMYRATGKAIHRLVASKSGGRND